MRFATAAAFIGAVSATPLEISDYIRAATNTPAHNTSTSNEPCALISHALRHQTEDNPVPLNATVAYACLQSVPLHAKDAALELEGIKTFTQFQSTLAYLKDPPEGFLYPAVDVFGALDQIADKLANNEYAGEYDFQMDILNTIASAHDGHFWYFADLTQIFTFRRASLFSISKDGLSVPEVYLGDNDLAHLLRRNGSNSTVSPVAQINGQDVEQYLNEYAALNGNNQDPDANYNYNFPEYVRLEQSVGIFAATSQYLGPVTKYTFKNGTSRTLNNYASTKANFTGVVDGKSFFKKFCTPQESSSDDEATPSSTGKPVIPTTEVPFRAVPTQTANPGPINYPMPVIINDDNSVAGYHPKSNKELAVLSIPTFQPADDTQFSNVVRRFLAMSQAAGKKKLIIDTRGNGGGSVALAYDLFSQLFPKNTPYGATNFRATPLGNDVGTIVSDFYSNVTNTTVNPNECNNPTDFSINPFNYRELLTVNDTKFTSWPDLFGPHEYHGDNFTSLTRYNLNDKYSFCTNISGFGNVTNITPVQVFQPQDIILVQDGICASTCAVFSEFMKSQKSIKQIVFGGRAQTGPQQGVGGVKGANIYGFDLLASAIEEAGYDDANPQQMKYFMETYGNLTKPSRQALARAAIVQKERQAKVNIRNNIRMGDTSVTPLQFIYEAADCRSFYTAPMIMDQSLVWKAAYEAMFGNGTCVVGSTGHPSSKPGVYEDNSPPGSAKNFFGADVRGPYPVSNSTGTSTGSEPTTTTVGKEASASASTEAYTGGAAGLSFNGLMMGFAGLIAAYMLM